MRKTILFALWLLVPVVLLAYHFGPGQSRLAMDRAGRKIAEARALEAKEDWQAAFEAWSAALAATPQDKTIARLQLQLAQARTRMYTGELPEAMEDMDKLLTEAQRIGADKKFEHEVRGTLASAQYYAGWLMRLEGAPSEEWLQPVESARQNFRLLAEETKDVKAAKDYEKNLEATIRLARMDLSELQGMPLPKFCSGCKNVSQKCRNQCQAKAEEKGEPKEKKDARGAGFNEIPKGGS
jgi:tetratricopeptide (TPR) repeat protein